MRLVLTMLIATFLTLGCSTSENTGNVVPKTSSPAIAKPSAPAAPGSSVAVIPEWRARVDKKPHPVTGQIQGIHLCCAECEKLVQDILIKVVGVRDVTCDIKHRLVRFMAIAGEHAVNAHVALKAEGFGGKLEHDGEEVVMTVDSDFFKTEVPEVLIKGVHVCCPGCEKALREAFRNTKVTFEGTGPKKRIRVTRKQNFNESEILAVFKAAGFWGELDEE